MVKLYNKRINRANSAQLRQLIFVERVTVIAHTNYLAEDHSSVHF